MRLLLMTILILALRPLSAQEFVFFNEPNSADLFASFNCVMRLLLYYEKGQCAGVEVDFQKNGVYYEASRGSNWWQYFFEPIIAGDPDMGLPIPCSERRANEVTERIAEDCRREEFHKMVRKYIHAKPSIRQKVQQYYKKNFKGHVVIGLHYTALNRPPRTPRIEFDRLSDEVHRYLKENKVSDFRLFVSTDEQAFLNMMRMLFPNRVNFLRGVRSIGNAPIAIKNPYDHAERQIMECLLLTKTDVLISSPSHLSTWAASFNLALPVIKIEGKRIPDYR